MKELIPLLLILIVISSAFSANIDPYLLKEFDNSKFRTFSEHKAKFLVLYKGTVPSGNIIKNYPFNVVEMTGTLKDIKKIANNSNVIYIFGNRQFRTFLNETINKTNSSIGDVPQIFSKYNGSGIRLEVIDNGANWSLFNTTHYNLSNNVGDHGTFVTSEIISNNSPYFGIARGVTFYDGNSFRTGFLDEILDGINWGLMNKVNIESMSLGTDSVGFGHRDPYLQLLFDTIFSQNNDTLFIIAAGNNGSNRFTIAQPGSSTPMNVITVGAIDKKGIVENFSSRGPLEDNRIKPDICATGILNGFAANGSIIGMEGTSMSTPLVAGAAALVEQAARESNISLSPKEVKLILMEGANKTDLFACGAGILNISKSISLLNSSIIEVNDNYLGFVGNTTDLTIRVRNFGNSSNFNVSIYYYNGTLWNSTKISVNKSHYKSKTFELKIPNLPWNESYGFITLNNSAHLPFSWAKSVTISAYDLENMINITNRFYTLNYSELPNAPLIMFNIYYFNNNISNDFITDSDRDISGFAFENNSKGSFSVIPYYPQQISNGKFYNLVNESGNLSYWDYSNMEQGNNLTISGKHLILIDGQPLVFVDDRHCKDGDFIDGVFCNDYIISYNSSAKITLYDSSQFNILIYNLVGSKYIDGIGETDVNRADFYSFWDYLIYGSNPSSKITVPKQISIKPLSPVEINVSISGNYSNSTVPFYVWFNSEGLFSKNQIVILEKNISFRNGQNVSHLDLFFNKNTQINYCLGELETIKGSIICSGIENHTNINISSSGTSGSLKMDDSWLSDLVEIVSEMLYLHVK